MIPRPDESAAPHAFDASPAAPIPNPPFIFPMLPPPPPGRSQPDAGSVSGRRFPNRSTPNHISVAIPPDLDFPPSASDTTPTPTGSLTHSPSRSINMPPRSGGHRRGGSEFIGGDGTATGPGLMSTSPTKNESSLSSPPMSGRGPPGGRRGHAHRRSAAISHHDLSTILKPAGELRSGSAPTTPSDPNGHRQFLPSLDRSVSQPALTAAPSPPSTPSAIRRESGPVNGQPRPRVGFSDTLEFIPRPRPLSTISSETSSSLSTIRASHSLTNSISSILSANPSTPPSAKISEPIFETPLEHDSTEKRPSSAGALLNNYTSSNSLYSNAISLPRPTSAAGSPRAPSSAFRNPSPTRRFLFHRQPPEDELSPKCTMVPPTHTAVLKASSQSLQDFRHATPEKRQAQSLSSSRPRSSPEASRAKRQKKARSWGFHLSRKGKQRTPEDMSLSNSSSAPLRDFAPLDNFSLEEVNFDDDTTCVIHTPQYDAPKPVEGTFPVGGSSDLTSSRDMESPSPVLDLDAALAAFDGGDDDDQSGSSGFSSAKRRMHSGGATGAFIGPGMHYHRRAESAPVMAPVDYQAFGIHRLASNPTMADVFEEEEEDENNAQDSQRRIRGGSKSRDSAELESLGVEVVDVGENGHGSTRPSPRRAVSGNSDNARGVNLSKSLEEMSTKPMSHDREVFQRPVIDIVHDNEEPRFSTVTKTSDDSTITPTLSHHQPDAPSLADSTEYAVSRPMPYYDQTDTASSISSPDFMHGSFDAPRLHTANSSITDRTTWSSSRPGEPGQWLSTEDVPSLTSSASTTISGPHPRLSNSGGTRPLGERSASFSAAVPRRTRPVSAGKRASLASLSRLVGSSYGEKSKLSIESRAQDDAEKPDKKKGNRISRLMRFWKSKEKLAA